MVAAFSVATALGRLEDLGHAPVGRGSLMVVVVEILLGMNNRLELLPRSVQTSTLLTIETAILEENRFF